MPRYGWDYGARGPARGYPVEGNWRGGYREPYGRYGEEMRGTRYGADYWSRARGGRERYRRGHPAHFDQGLEHYYSGTHHGHGPIGQSFREHGYTQSPERSGRGSSLRGGVRGAGLGRGRG